jgi:hypothetical protein
MYLVAIIVGIKPQSVTIGGEVSRKILDKACLRLAGIAPESCPHRFIESTPSRAPRMCRREIVLDLP